MIREKSLLRKQICVAINLNDYETARSIMTSICKNEIFTRRNWSNEETEYLMNHVKSIGYEKAIKRVAEKLGRTQLSAKKKHANEIKRMKGKRPSTQQCEKSQS